MRREREREMRNDMQQKVLTEGEPAQSEPQMDHFSSFINQIS